MKKLFLISLLFLTGCATYQPREGYDAVILSNLSTDSTMIQNPDIVDARLVLALRDNIQDETASMIRKAGKLEVIGQCRDRVLELKGTLASISVKVQEKSSGILNREHKEFKDYKVSMRGNLVDCKSGRIVDYIALEETADEVQQIASQFSKDLARFIEFKKQ